MKKFLSFIIILIALVGFLGSTVKVSAQITPPAYCNQAAPADPTTMTGTCTTSGNPPTVDTQSTQGACTSPSIFTADTYGVCTNINGGINTQTCWTKTSCIQNGGTFAGYYNLLQPLPGVGSVYNPISTPGQPTNLSSYLNPMITVFIGICAVLAVVMILFGGIEYMTSELISSKEAGKERIRNALLGLVLALGAWTILYTINPNLLNSDIKATDINAKM